MHRVFKKTSFYIWTDEVKKHNMMIKKICKCIFRCGYLVLWSCFVAKMKKHQFYTSFSKPSKPEILQCFLTCITNIRHCKNIFIPIKAVQHFYTTFRFNVKFVFAKTVAKYSKIPFNTEFTLKFWSCVLKVGFFVFLLCEEKMSPL